MNLQILIYRSVLSPVSPLYYSVAGNAGFGQRPYSFVGRGFTPAVFRFKISLRREQGLALRYDPIISQIGIENKVSADLLVGAFIERPFFVLRLFAGDQ